MHRRVPLLLVVTACCAVAAAGLATRLTAAAFTATTIVPGNQLTADKLASYFSATPGTAVQAGTSTPVASGNVDTLALAFGAVPSARTFTSVFTVKNVSAQTQTATLNLSGVAQVASAVFAGSGTGTATLAAGASTAVTITTSSAVAGHGSGTLRLGLSGSNWLYRDYALTIDESPEAPGSLTATARAAGRIQVAWTASSTTTNLAGYDVYRGAGSGSFVKLTSSPVGGTSYDDTATADGTTYTYKVDAVSIGTPALSSLDSPMSTATADATPPAQPTSVGLANGGGTGGAYVNLANRSSVAVSVGLPSTSIASDTVTVTLSSGGRSVSGTATASAGIGTITVSGIDASTLPDGTVTISATSTDLAGNASAARTATAPKDTVAPAAPSVTYVDNKSAADQITGSTEAGATVTANRTAPSAAGPYTVTAAADGSYTVSVATSKGVSVTYTVTATDAAGNASAAATLTASDTR